MKIQISMPVFNEEEAISEFVEELFATFAMHSLAICIINDRSSDGTPEKLLKLKTKYGEKLQIIENIENLGHGPSTLLGLKRVLEVEDWDLAITIDGDGQFISKEILDIVDLYKNVEFDILEGYRTKRSDPYFRKIVTNFCKVIVLTLAKQTPKDANTPLRIYKRPALLKIVKLLPEKTITPNLFISIISRRMNFNLHEISVTSIPRRAAISDGSTWKQRYKMIPSKRFLKFCIRASVQVLDFSRKLI